jgi:addiction module HigA family antidote
VIFLLFFLAACYSPRDLGQSVRGEALALYPRRSANWSPSNGSRVRLRRLPLRSIMQRQRKQQPTHPGAILLTHHLEPLGIGIGDAAQRLGVSRKTLSKIVNQRGAVSPEMALRLARGFATTPELWLNLQQAYDLSLAERLTSWRKVQTIEAAT